MFEKNLPFYFSIIVGSVLAGLSVNVSTSGAPDYLLGNLTQNTNLTAAQTHEISDKLFNYTNSIKEKAKGNLTQMNIFLLDDMVKRNIIDEKDKQDSVALISGLNQIKPTSNLTIINNEVSSLVEEFASNSSNPILIALKDNLKKKTGPIPGIPGLPPLTIGSLSDLNTKWGVGIATCAMWGFAAYGIPGEIAAMTVCNAIM